MPAACYIGGYIAVKIGARADMKSHSAAFRHPCVKLRFEMVTSLLLSNIYSYLWLQFDRLVIVDGSSMCRAAPSMRREVMPMTDLTDFVKLLTALVSLLTALIGLTEALKQHTKHKKRGRRR